MRVLSRGTSSTGRSQVRIGGTLRCVCPAMAPGQGLRQSTSLATGSVVAKRTRAKNVHSPSHGRPFVCQCILRPQVLTGASEGSTYACRLLSLSGAPTSLRGDPWSAATPRRPEQTSSELTDIRDYLRCRSPLPLPPRVRTDALRSPTVPPPLDQGRSSSRESTLKAARCG